jgi:cation:H+ antiporter
MWILVLWLILGLVLLKQGASWFVDGSAGLAKKLNVSELAIGLTVVAFGTSAPELVVNIFAVTNGNDEIVISNVIGSNLFNLFVILSLAGLIIPLNVKSSTAWKEIPFSFFALLMMFVLANDRFIFNHTHGVISRTDAAIMLMFFVLFILYVYKQLKKEHRETEKINTALANYKIALLILIGLAGLIAGGKLVLDNAVKLAQLLQLSEKIIGLTIVAAGTSLPELATSIVAAAKRSSDIAVGNIIGSNIFNILFILSISSLVRPVRFDPSFNLDIYILAGGSALLFIAMYTGRRRRIDRWEAMVLILMYGIYMVYMFNTSK